LKKVSHAPPTKSAPCDGDAQHEYETKKRNPTKRNPSTKTSARDERTGCSERWRSALWGRSTSANGERTRTEEHREHRYQNRANASSARNQDATDRSCETLAGCGGADPRSEVGKAGKKSIGGGKWGTCEDRGRSPGKRADRTPQNGSEPGRPKPGCQRECGLCRTGLRNLKTRADAELRRAAGEPHEQTEISAQQQPRTPLHDLGPGTRSNESERTIPKAAGKKRDNQDECKMRRRREDATKAGIGASKERKATNRYKYINNIRLMCSEHNNGSVTKILEGDPGSLHSDVARSPVRAFKSTKESSDPGTDMGAPVRGHSVATPDAAPVPDGTMDSVGLGIPEGTQLLRAGGVVDVGQNSRQSTQVVQKISQTGQRAGEPHDGSAKRTRPMGPDPKPNELRNRGVAGQRGDTVATLGRQWGAKEGIERLRHDQRVRVMMVLKGRRKSQRTKKRDRKGLYETLVTQSRPKKYQRAEITLVLKGDRKKPQRTGMTLVLKGCRRKYQRAEITVIVVPAWNSVTVLVTEKSTAARESHISCYSHRGIKVSLCLYRQWLTVGTVKHVGPSDRDRGSESGRGQLIGPKSSELKTAQCGLNAVRRGEQLRVDSATHYDRRREKRRERATQTR
jgi:hypothetical protein